MKGKTRDGIRQRGGSYLVDVTVQGERRTATYKSYEEAVIGRLQLEAELRGAVIKREAAATPNSWTIQQAYEKTLEVRWQGTKNETKAARNARDAVAFFGKARALDSIDKDAIDEYIKHLRKKGNSAGTMNRKLASLSAMFTDAEERGGVAKRPRMIRLPEPTHRIRYMSPDEEQLLAQLMIQWNQPAVLEAITVLVDTGMRVGELLHLEIKDIDLRENIISIWQNKGDLPRSVPMTQRVREIIAGRCAASRGLVFYNLTRETLRYYWDRARSAMGLDDDDQFVPHALRHTCATRLVQSGVSLYVVQKILGHSSIQVTEKYAHLSSRELKDAIRVLQGTVVPALQPVAKSATFVAEPVMAHR
jgi:integrase